MDDNEQKKTPCVDCGFLFYVKPKDKEFYDKLNFELPKRCFYCRRKRRQRREQQG